MEPEISRLLHLRSFLSAPTDDAIHRRLLRDDITQTLLRLSEEDLTDRRSRFIPRSSLRAVLNFRCVLGLLETLPGVSDAGTMHLQELAGHLSPDARRCSCLDKHCTGGRMIVATLLFIGRDDLIRSLCGPRNHLSLCDRSLPVKLDQSKGGPAEHMDREIGVLLPGLSSKEKELFTSLQWQVCVPMFSEMTLQSKVRTFPDQMTLPWIEIDRMEDSLQGDLTYVERIKIHPDHHVLPCGNDNIFVLKTMGERLAPGLANEKFQQEVQVNRELPKHQRIVPLLSAFKHRGKYYQIFPHATAHNLRYVWESFTPRALVRDYAPVAHWYSAEWLVSECRGLAEALVVTHGLGGQDHLKTSPGFLHADIKPENILCFIITQSDKTILLLKLADFGESKKMRLGIPLKASRVAHIKTYRPPEHSPGLLLDLNYDVWCLGCLFLDFITWAICGRAGIDAFRDARLDEDDDPAAVKVPGQVIEDVFFKKVLRGTEQPMSLEGDSDTTESPGCNETDAGSGQHTKQNHDLLPQVVPQVKDCVILQIENLQKHENCTPLLKQVLPFVLGRMLVVRTEIRASALEVQDFLRHASLEG